MTELPRYHIETPERVEGMELRRADDGPYVLWADVSSRLQQLEEENAALTVQFKSVGIVPYLDRMREHSARVSQLEQEKATLETELKELRARVDSQGESHEAIVPRPHTGA